MGPAERTSQREERRRNQREEAAWLREIPDALEFRLAGEETIGGRPVLVVECSPRPGYRARNQRARLFEKSRGRLWIDKAESQLVRGEAEVFETVGIGWGVLAKIEKGTKFHLQRVRVADDVWLPEVQTVRFAARLLLVKNARHEFTTRYSDFRRRDPAPAAASGH
jgi:hypothetical protein